MPRSAPALPCATRPPSAPRPCHACPTHQPSVSPAKECHRCPTQRAGGVERCPPGDRSLSPRKRGGFTPTEGFTASSEAFPTRGRPYTNVNTQTYGMGGFRSLRMHFSPWHVFLRPDFCFSVCMEAFFSGDGTLSYPPRFTHLLFGALVEARLCT